ncbi:MAG: TIGR04086 family membrane protein [Ruminococcus flavefaciens]|nr:TIGR04086 family membrane protein [Ruminococcus flavefaciens]MCM1228815.1 TIGR04086 family membrane protein [Ruminococcus flavefaciens]
MRRHRQSLWTNTFFSFAVPVSVGAVCIFLCSAVFSMLAFFVFKNMMFADIFTVLSLSVGGISGGYLCGKYRRHRGLIDGAVCGGLLYALIFAVGACFGEFTDIKKLLLLVVAGAVGGVSGVNSKRPKNLM